MSTIAIAAIAYCVAILFPIPWLSPLIVNGWASLFAWVKSKASGTTLPVVK